MRRLLVSLGFLVIGCEGILYTPDLSSVPPVKPDVQPDVQPDPVLSFQCEPSNGPGASDVRRLNRAELTNTLYELFGRADFAAAQTVAASLPADTRNGLYARQVASDLSGETELR